MAGWFPTTKGEERGWRLDIVGLLAVLGESTMEEHAQAITASWVCMLPRLIPAPHALLKPARPTRMPPTFASVYGVFNGNHFDELNYFPNLIHPVQELQPYDFQVFEITRNTKSKRVRTFCEYDSHDDPPPPPKKKISSFGRTFSWKPPPHVPSKKTSPLNLLNIFSFFLTIGLLIWALLIHDGVACIALFTISFATSVVGLASKWQPTLMQRHSRSKDVPRGDVVIRTRGGAIVVVKCDESIARELYNGTDECEYIVGPQLYRGLVGLGTLLVMMAVVLLGNCRWTMQAAIGISYMVLNGLFWAAALIPKDKNWDLSSYDVKDITPADAKDASYTSNKNDPEMVASFTRTLWYAIRETNDIDWVTETEAAPRTKTWESWLKLAEENMGGNRSWKAVTAKDAMFERHEDGRSVHGDGEKNVLKRPGRERAPAHQIPIHERK